MERVCTSMIAIAIVACEVAFWAFVLAGLACRYLLRAKRLGGILLACTPLVDLLLLILTGVDLRNGATATFVHGLAAVYIGVSIAFGPRMIQWADEQFAYRFAGGPAPRPRPKHGPEHARLERQGWYRHLLAWIIGSAVLGGLILYVGDATRTQELQLTILRWLLVLGVDFVWSFSYTIWPQKASEV